MMMGLVSDGISEVRAFGLAAGISADGGSVDGPLKALVRWRSEHEDKLYQVYVDGRLGGVTADCQQRQMVVSLRSSWQRALQIEVCAVEAGEANIDFVDQLSAAGRSGSVEVSWLRRMSLPIDGWAQVFSNGGDGEVDHGLPVSTEDVVLWPAWQDKCGFGLGRFGSGDFGFDGSAAVGFGKGGFGFGEFGFDADVVRWQSCVLGTGAYKFAVRVT
ncbi:MAG: hypothetical protein KAR47_03320, partial [Planctomycetes bacterium]|nr:hypothetical protein [Planctomycetota bacterium]